MRTELGDLVRDARLNQRLTPQGVARRMGYRNVNKGARRVERLERTGIEAPVFIGELAAAVGCDLGQAADLAARDDVARRSAFEAWLNVPQPLQLFRTVVGLAIGVELPAGPTEEEAIAFAVNLQRKERVRMCLVLDRRRSIWILEDGARHLTQTTMDRPNSPYNTVG